MNFDDYVAEQCKDPGFAHRLAIASIRLNRQIRFDRRMQGEKVILPLGRFGYKNWLIKHQVVKARSN